MPLDQARRERAEQRAREIQSMLRSFTETTTAGFIFSPRWHRALTAALLTFADQEVRARDEAWTEYADWLSDVAASHYTISMIHGFTDSPELIEEGTRRRAALGYIPKSERQPPAPPEKERAYPGPDPLPGGQP